MYLAEDWVGAKLNKMMFWLILIQILCWELVSKHGGAWILYYVKSACTVTDIPDQVNPSI
jgi:chitin synthase